MNSAKWAVLLTDEYDKFWGVFVELLSRSKAAQHSVAQIIAMIVMNLVTLRAAAELEILFNKPAFEEWWTFPNKASTLKMRKGLTANKKYWSFDHNYGQMCGRYLTTLF